MKKITISILVLAILVLPQLSGAQETTDDTATSTLNPSILQSNKEVIRARIEQRFETMKQNQAERKVQFADERKERVAFALGNIFRRFENVEDKMLNAGQRISSALAEMEAEGIDVSEAATALELAEESLDLTMSEFDAVKEKIEEALEEEVSREFIHDLIYGLKESVKGTHAAYRNVINIVKEIIAENNL